MVGRGGGAGGGGDGSRRVRGTTVPVGVVHGSHAVWQGARSAEGRSHKWTLYLRPAEKLELSHFIKHVDFLLHESFEPSVVRVESMPYEMSEYGWGEFEATLRVTFRDPAERPLLLFHPVKLFPPGGEHSRRPVVAEFYDELVFHDPPERLLSLLRSTPRGPAAATGGGTRVARWHANMGRAEAADLARIDGARARVRGERDALSARYEALASEQAALARELSDAAGRDV